MSAPTYNKAFSPIKNIQALLRYLSVASIASTVEAALVQLVFFLTLRNNTVRVVASSVTAKVGERLAVNTTAGALTVTLPLSPEAGDRVEIIDAAATFDTYNVTVARNGQPIDSAASNLTLSTENVRLLLIYINSTIGWKSYYAASAADSMAITGALTVGTTLGVTGAATLGGGLTASGSAANDFSASTGTFKTSTGLHTFGGKAAFKVVATPVAATGAGGGVAGAAALGSANIVTISSDGATKGVKLLTGVAGDIVDVINTSGTAANLFAASGGTINGGSANAGCAVPASKGVRCFCTAADTWTVVDHTARAGAAA
jgi:hypothetical protein